MADFSVENHGSIVFIRPHTQPAIDWVNEHVGEDNGYQPQWPAVLVEPRYAADIVAGMEADGLEKED